jgi:anti-sigma regulatory factor (Ser/Thr protein kinase)
MAPSLALQLGTDGHAVRAARIELRDWLRNTPCRPDCPDRVELVVSELVTNALLHTQTPTDLRATVTEGAIHIEVHDRASVPPRTREAQGAGGGFGLHIVDAIAVDWGWRATPDGKVVWADVPL